MWRFDGGDFEGFSGFEKRLRCLDGMSNVTFMGPLFKTFDPQTLKIFEGNIFWQVNACRNLHMSLLSVQLGLNEVSDSSVRWCVLWAKGS